MTRVLLLGGTGFLGRHVAPVLTAAGCDVATLSRSPAADIVLDASDLDALAGHLHGTSYDTVVNLLGAGLGSGPWTDSDVEVVNGVLPARLFEILSELPTPPHLIHTASSTERANASARDESVYSRSKTTGTQGLLMASDPSGEPLTILTLHNTYGSDQPADRFVAMVTARLHAEVPVDLEYPDRVRDFVHVDDVAATFLRAVLDRPEGRAEFEVGTGVGLTLLDAATEIAEATGSPPTLVRRVTPALLDANPVSVCPVRRGDLGLCTTEFHEGIRRTVKGTSCAGS